MLYLYLGFLLAQSYSVINVIYTANVSLLIAAFSMIVFFTWSVLPIMGYGLAKLLGAKGYCNKHLLIALGSVISLSEQALFHFDIYTKDGYAPILITGSLFFVIAYLQINTKRDVNLRNIY